MIKYLGDSPSDQAKSSAERRHRKSAQGEGLTRHRKTTAANIRSPDQNGSQETSDQVTDAGEWPLHNNMINAMVQHDKMQLFETAEHCSTFGSKVSWSIVAVV